MGNRRNKYIGGGVGGISMAAWSTYSHFTTAKDLPEDAGWLAQIIADPPIYAPYLLLLISVAFLASLFWKSEDSEVAESGSNIATTSGPHSPALNGPFHGPVTINTSSPPAAVQPARSPYGSGSPPKRSRTWDEVPIRRDVGLAEAFAYAITGRWGVTFLDALKDDLSNAAPVSHARQLAFDGLIKIWGKRTASGVYEEIPRNYWADYQPEWFSLMRGEPHTERTSLSADHLRFLDLMASKAEFEREWPTRAVATKSAKQLPDLLVRDLLERIANERGVRDDGSIEMLRQYREVARDMSDQFSLHDVAVWGRTDGRPLARLDDESARRGFGVGRYADGKMYCTKIHHNEDGVQVWIDHLHVRREEVERIWPVE